MYFWLNRFLSNYCGYSLPVIMKPESKKVLCNTNQSCCNAGEITSCYDLCKLSKALEEAALKRIDNDAKKLLDGNSTIYKHNETGSCFDLSKLSDATEEILLLTTPIWNSNVATVAAGARQSERDAPYDFSELEKALNAPERNYEKATFLLGKRLTFKRKQKQYRMFLSTLDLNEPKLEKALDAAEGNSKRKQKQYRMNLSTLDLNEPDRSDIEKLDQTMQQRKNYSIFHRLERIVEIGAGPAPAPRRVVISRCFGTNIYGYEES
ncbi:hypothetical protein CFOL_v3_15272 [Cephalotus follicularis]|uniref:Uncharacterized protein n=1 Tax=Cephalotus follicularis TaxID=3775 RepID=A0A1Q3BVH0_CEPFO|nr:hypothetical protein CFOL_v3_15272 [Cephalotus follicularis]